LNSKLF